MLGLKRELEHSIDLTLPFQENKRRAHLTNPSILHRHNAVEGDHYFIGLDLDECSLLGRDTNDYFRVLHEGMQFRLENPSMDEEEIIQIKETFKDGLKHAVNPAMIRALHAIRDRQGYMPYVFVYTNKGNACNDIKKYVAMLKTILEKFTRLPQVSNQHKQEAREWYEKLENETTKFTREGKTVFMEGGPKDGNIAYLIKTFEDKIRPFEDLVTSYGFNEFSNEQFLRFRKPIVDTINRISYGTWAISQLLDTEYNVPVFISNVDYKNLHDLVGVLGLSSIEKLWLYDDNAEVHYQNMCMDLYASRSGPRDHSTPTQRAAAHGLRSAIDFHMIPVEPYNAQNMELTNRIAAENSLKAMINNPEAFFSTRENLKHSISSPKGTWTADKLLLKPRTFEFSFGGGTIRLNNDAYRVPSWDISMFRPPPPPPPPPYGMRPASSLGFFHYDWM